MNKSTQPSWEGIRIFLNKRIFPGFRIGEMIAWLLFYLIWLILFTFIYYTAGRFNTPDFVTLSKFISIQVVVYSTNALFFLPLWWFFFVKLKKVPLIRKVVIHIFTALVYTACCLSTFYLVLNKMMGMNYAINNMIPDSYNQLFFYTFHFALFHAYNFWLHTKEQMKREQALRELAYQSEIKALKSQIEPHFLFNTLNTISASVPPTLEETRVLIAQLADTFRYALRVSESQFVSLGDEIDFMKTWLALEKQRFGDRLKIGYRLDPMAMQAMVPPMLLQPIVENALNHGIANKIGGGTVTIQCQMQDEAVYIAVSDTGVGYAGDLEQILHKSVGLSNISKRLALLYNEKLYVERQQEGLQFSFYVPTKKEMKG